MIQRKFLSILLLIVLTLPSHSQNIIIETEVIPLPHSNTDDECVGTFATHFLDHITTTPNGNEIRQFEANGSGVAINDLDNDRDLDIVLANHAGLNTILWNEGNLNFRTEHLSHGDSRAVTIVDFDGDGWNDIFFTRTLTAPSYWHNKGNGTFELQIIPNVAEPLYSVAWADIDRDGDLDLVGGSYDAALLDAFGQEFLLNSRGGVYYYENEDGTLNPKKLINRAQALALILTDINNDTLLDIVVGNDFAVPDFFWLQTDDGWQNTSGFDTFTYSTMSYDFADINNDGKNEIFSTDMKPYATESSEAWQPILDDMHNTYQRGNNPQVMENVLLSQSSDSAFENHATNMGIDASGWSWSGKFGDLDQDGFLDLYIVNGFIEYTLFAHLDNHELIEQNLGFRNIDGNIFEHKPQWGLGSPSSGRGMSMADLDMDGDLDIVVNNLRNSAELFENQLCTGTSLQVDLKWHNSLNTRAIGTEMILHTSIGNYIRTVKSSSGYLSGDTSRIHFGIPSSAIIETLEINWSDGEQSVVDIPSQAQYMIVERID